MVQRRGTKQLYVTKTVKKRGIVRWEERQGERMPAELANLLALDHHNIGNLSSILAASLIHTLAV